MTTKAAKPNRSVQVTVVPYQTIFQLKRPGSTLRAIASNFDLSAHTRGHSRHCRSRLDRLYDSAFSIRTSNWALEMAPIT